MTTFPRFTAAVIIALAVAGAAGAARASGPMGGHGGPGMGRMCSDMEARMAAKAAYAEVKLGLTEDQKAGFKALNAAMAAAGEPIKTACAEMAAQDPAATPPARMVQMRKMMEARLASLDTVIPAMSRFYDSLTPEQKKTADGMMMGRHGPMGH